MGLSSQVTLFPEIYKQKENNIFIKKVELTDQFTIIDFHFKPLGESWICAENSFHIKPTGTENKLYMIVAKNIKMCPEMQKVGSFSDHLDFQLWFPLLPKNVGKIDIIEKTRNGLNFYAVKINNGQERSVPDSARYKSAASFENYFINNSGSLAPIEGIWVVHIKQSVYVDRALKEKDYADTLIKVAILKNGNEFHAYNLDGSPTESVFKWISGGKRYYYTQYFRGVDQEVSDYVKEKSTDFYEINLQIPTRLARYILINDYFMADELHQSLTFKKEMPLPDY
ncbi:MAG: hypothetical protein DRI73_01250 [Bacteroidetes bacterium]|nr:MAG: hypothetical protein DRI73_01250 [Bacteroidota bacterium]